MNRTTNAKAYSAPTLWVDIGDLRIPCAVPNVEMTERILEQAQHVTEFTNGALTQEGYDYAFALFAEILSCNHNFVKYTPEELQEKRVTVAQILGILTDWVRFIGDLANQKN